MPHSDWQDFCFDGIGTRWQISAPAPLDPTLRHHLLAVVERYDATWSRFREDSLVTEMSRRPGRYQFPDEASALGSLYKTLYGLSSGAMTPLIGGSLEQLGYDAAYSLKPKGPPSPAPRWEDSLSWNGTVLTATGPLVLDIGAAGKGQLVDLLCAELVSHGINDFIIDASGDLLNHGAARLRVALEHPFDPGSGIGVVSLGAGALCASASNRRMWGNGLHHVLDGETGVPVQTVAATWAVAETAMLADALATALFLVPSEKLEQHFGVSWLKVFSDGSATYSGGFEGTLFS